MEGEALSDGDAGEIGGPEGRQDRDTQEPGTVLTRGAAGGAHHVDAAGRVQREHADIERRALDISVASCNLAVLQGKYDQALVYGQPALEVARKLGYAIGEADALTCIGTAELRRGKHPLDAGLEVLRRIVRQTERQAKWQPALLKEDRRPAFDINFYVLGLDGSWAGVTLAGGGSFAVADVEGGPRLEKLVPLFS